MALIIKDRVKETTTTTGTGNIALGGAVSNFVTFSSVLSDSDTTYYAIVDSNNSDFEVGLGTYVSSGNTIARTTVLASSNSGSAVDLSAGSKVIFCAFPADKAVVEDANGVVSIENLQFDTNAIKSTNTNGNIQLFPTGTGFTELYGNTNAGAIRFNCESNSHGVTLKGHHTAPLQRTAWSFLTVTGQTVSFSRQTAAASWRLQARFPALLQQLLKSISLMVLLQQRQKLTFLTE